MFEQLFARLVACDGGDPGSIPAETCLSQGALVEDGDGLGRISSYRS
jgi:hypothetical protein